MAGNEWYYVQAGQRLGPVPAETLRNLISAGVVGPGDLVWTEGMADWSASSAVPGLAPAPRPVSPPSAYAQPTQPQYHAPPQYAAPQYGTQQYPAPQYAPHPQHGYGAPVNYYAPQGMARSDFAGFWLRFIAMLIDGVVMGVVFWIGVAALATATGASIIRSPGSAPAQLGAALSLIYLMGLLLPWLYFAFMESSASQGTPGKRALGLRVTDEAGGRISFARASGRFFGRILSSFFLIGYLMAAFTERKQALHDILSGCLVVQA